MAKYEEYIRLAENDLKVAELVLNSANDELMQNSKRLLKRSLFRL